MALNIVSGNAWKMEAGQSKVDDHILILNKWDVDNFNF